MLDEPPVPVECDVSTRGVVDVPPPPPVLVETGPSEEPPPGDEVDRLGGESPEGLSPPPVLESERDGVFVESEVFEEFDLGVVLESGPVSLLEPFGLEPESPPVPPSEPRFEPEPPSPSAPPPEPESPPPLEPPLPFAPPPEPPLEPPFPEPPPSRSTSLFLPGRWKKPPSMMFFFLMTSRPVTLPRIFPHTFMTEPKTSINRPSSGDTWLMVRVSRLRKSAILVPHLEIAVTAWATTTGVPKPRVNTVSSTQEISLPTRSAMRSRTVSRTNATTSPKSITTVLIPLAVVAAPARASSCSLQDSR